MKHVLFRQFCLSQPYDIPKVGVLRLLLEVLDALREVLLEGLGEEAGWRLSHFFLHPKLHPKVH